MKTTKIILFSGFARHGKDQSATFLRRAGEVWENGPYISLC